MHKIKIFESKFLRIDVKNANFESIEAYTKHGEYLKLRSINFKVLEY